jgi:hypothetical protein
MTNTKQAQPNEVANLEAAYGAPSQEGFGSTVFYEPLKVADDLEKMELEKYSYSVGELRRRCGKDAWMGP